MKTTYIATFSDGAVLSRKSKRGYAFAWRVTWTKPCGGSCGDSGFAASADLATKAAKPSLPYGIWRGMSASNRASADAKNAEFLQNCNLSIEIVPVSQ